jgi:uncharacterized membrane protein YcaP (DUF421 family)
MLDLLFIYIIVLGTIIVNTIYKCEIKLKKSLLTIVSACLMRSLQRKTLGNRYESLLFVNPDLE